MSDKISKHFATQLQEFVYQRTYARDIYTKRDAERLGRKQLKARNS